MYYGWRVVAGAFTTQMFIVGFFSYSVSLLTPSLREGFGVTLEQVMYGMTIGTVAGLVFSPLAGVMVDRYPVRALMAAGSLAFGIGLFLLSRVGSITAYVWVFGITMAVANCFAATIPALAVVSRWFTVNRGRALGIAAIGTSVGGALVPSLVNVWLEIGGWRVAVEYMAYCVLGVMLPAALFLIRGRPEDVGLRAEHDPGAPDTAEAGTASARQILASFNFWSMALSMGLTMAAYSAILSNLTPYAKGAGYTDDHASTLIMAVAVMGLIGKLLFGTGADRFNLKLGLWLAQSLALLAFLVFSTEPPFVLMVLAACSMGLAAGGLLPVWGAMLARIFGLESYGLAMGLMSPVVTLCVIPTFVIVGRLVDTYGSFESPMLLFSGTTLLAMLVLLPLRIPARAPLS
jgi:MFS family permease